MTHLGASSPQVRKALFVLGNLTVVAVLACTVVFPILDYFQARQSDIESKSTVLARLTAIAAQATNVQKRIQQPDIQTDRGEFLVGSPSIVTADLQTKLKSLASAAGAQARSVQGLPIKVDGQLRYIGARIEIQGSLQSIHRAIYAIEGAKPYLFITEAVIKPMAPIGNPNTAQEPVIQAQLDVFGASRVEGRDP